MSIDIAFASEESDGDSHHNPVGNRNKRPRLSSNEDLAHAHTHGHINGHAHAAHHSHPHSLVASPITGPPNPFTSPTTNVGMGGVGGPGMGQMNVNVSLNSPIQGPGQSQGGLTPPKKLSRARSDSAPLGHGYGAGAVGSMGSASGLGPSGAFLGGVAGGGRPRSGSGLAPIQGGGGGPRTLVVPNIGGMRGIGGMPGR
jgi:hypothetical protein